MNVPILRAVSSSLIAVFLACCATAPQRMALEPPVRVLLLGDSISMGYTPFVQEALDERFFVTRPKRSDGRAINCAGTTKGVANIDEWLASQGAEWDVIHFNFGLHDLKRVKPDSGKNSRDPNDPPQATLEVYSQQLKEIARKLQATGARLVFATTTPIPGGELSPYRGRGESQLYNQTARRALRDLSGGASIEINDLWAFVEARPKMPRYGDVHFDKEGSRLLGEEVARVVREVAGLAR